MPEISAASRTIEQFPEDMFDAVYAVHVRGAFLLAKYAVPHMPEAAASS